MPFNNALCWYSTIIAKGAFYGPVAHDAPIQTAGRNRVAVEAQWFGDCSDVVASLRDGRWGTQQANMAAYSQARPAP